MHSIISNNTFWSYTLVFAHHTLKTIQFIELQCILKYFYVIHWTLQCNRSLITRSPHTQNNTQCLNSEQCILQWYAIHYYVILFTTHSKQYILHCFALHCVLWISMHCKKRWFISYNPIIHCTLHIALESHYHRLKTMHCAYQRLQCSTEMQWQGHCNNKCSITTYISSEVNAAFGWCDVVNTLYYTLCTDWSSYKLDTALHSVAGCKEVP